MVLSAAFVGAAAALPAVAGPGESSAVAGVLGSWSGYGLAMLGGALIAAELVLPTLGVLGFGGFVLLAAGLLLVFDGPAVTAGLTGPVLAGLAAVLAVYALLAAVVARRAYRHRVVTGDRALVGSEGTVITWTDRAGEVRIHGEVWQARAHGSLAPGSLAPGRTVRIVARHGLTLRVAPAPDPLAQGDPP
ncbi:NfeD family protein [Rhodoplanes sp. TEM]|uniref:NfeD family protein n=1 Tax=Rhodoplanes tepidamans TaxID=200616 RepID=A0ABT5J9M8_RHOTP|nr:MULTISPECIES: NfeD family protein [Rhodoplanes]MDC7786355.1 NfeD family protein [Rhodoplanes tepidamans]MDC7988131.1 NfeD family protein [Rhodoplanes sp. TEM]MDQ0354099.1 membrane-bound ClpP family serine protease [Rhodoplanes tepidamans]